MKYKFMTSLLLLSQLATAETLKGRVHAFIPGEEGVDSLLLLENGRVVFVQPKETKLLYEVNEENVEIEINQKNELLTMKKNRSKIYFHRRREFSSARRKYKLRPHNSLFYG